MVCDVAPWDNLQNLISKQEQIHEQAYTVSESISFYIDHGVITRLRCSVARSKHANLSCLSTQTRDK
jgi:hypothetical protein